MKKKPTPEQLALQKECRRVLRFLADLNGCNWIKGDGPGEIDMRQRSWALQQTLSAKLADMTGE